ncbi:MAG TPA: hybrid sensor histidine kinase/response regulator [Polyangia bacterium]|jgi:Signal transduction histidine kinase|nr:hybrid sensor histidine kinase/response regulator [Polyangia bacterium]
MSGGTTRQGVASILIVDDNPVNLQVLTSMLKQSGWRPRPVTSGQLGLQAARNEPPDLVLLDVNMPEMNGYEVCEQLKADTRLASIPVIFVSALGETMDKVRGFTVGGVDYITKPFQLDEVKARVTTHLELRRQRRELQASYDKLREGERLRDSLVHMIVHDLRSPLTAISAYLQLFGQEAKEKLGAETQEDIASAMHATRNMVRMINEILDVSKMEAQMMKLDLRECDLVQVVEQILDDLKSLVGARHLAFERPAAPARVLADQEIVSRIVQNFLANALRFAPADGEIRVGIVAETEHVRIFVADTGPGIPPDFRESIFDKFVQLDGSALPRNRSTGLGLAFCKMAVEAHGGRIGVDSEMGKGSNFWFTLPRQQS